MPLHIIKLCVGCDSVEDLESWIAMHSGHVHVTRMKPSRRDEILAGGSLYWVIKGAVMCRETILDLREETGGDGIVRCAIVLSGKPVRTRPHPKRPFQGWRYLTAADAPPDLKTGEGDDLPEGLQRELASLGLL